MTLSPDTPSAHLPSQSSQTFLLHTTLPHSFASVSTLIDSSATDNFIDKSLATLVATPQKLPLPIHLTLFDSSSTSTGDITHYVQITLSFANGQRQDLWLLVTCLHASTPLILGLPWLRSTNPRIDWWNLTLNFNCQAMEPPETISFNSFVLNAQLGESSQVLTTLVNSGATGTPIELQLFDGKPTTAKPITKSHTSSITLDNGLWFLVHLLVTQLPEVTPIVLELPWLHDVNSNIDWKDLTMNEAGATGNPTALLDNSGEPLSTQHILSAPPVFPPNIPHNKYKGPRYSTPRPWTTLDLGDMDQPSRPLDPDILDIKIIGLGPFTCILQDSTPAFQLHIFLALPEEHLGADTMAPELKTEKQILHKVVPLEYHEFADVFSEGSAKELPPHQSYDHKINLKDGLHPRA
ncbi:hypothetical protein C0993_010457 [Termitomyces sp. T159_Od127]|nr:hypothetical protein C0993_010457 [Termitomyces sp. T159_Od127]